MLIYEAWTLTWKQDMTQTCWHVNFDLETLIKKFTIILSTLHYYIPKKKSTNEILNYIVQIIRVQQRTLGKNCYYLIEMGFVVYYSILSFWLFSFFFGGVDQAVSTSLARGQAENLFLIFVNVHVLWQFSVNVWHTVTHLKIGVSMQSELRYFNCPSWKCWPTAF